MKIKYNEEKEVTKKEKKGSSNSKNNYTVRPEPLRKIYENNKSCLKKSLEVIKVSVQDQLSTIFEDYNGWRRGKMKKPDYIFNMFLDVSFASILSKVVKKNEDLINKHSDEFSEMLSSAVTELSKNKTITKGKEIIAIYSKLYEDLNESRIKKFAKLDLPGMDWDAALKLALSSHGTPKHTMNNVLRFIYSSIKTKNYDELNTLFKKIYGKDNMDRVSIYILLDRQYDKVKNSWVDREQYSVITNIALDELNSHTKDEIKDLLKLYCEERRRTEYTEFINRRVNFSTINIDDYGKIDSAIKKLVEKNEMYRIFLDHSRVSIKPLRTSSSARKF